jgi:DnaJ-class molecular chaperone
MTTEETTEKCPGCNYGQRWAADGAYQYPCRDCNGKGRVTPKKAEEVRERVRRWRGTV